MILWIDNRVLQQHKKMITWSENRVINTLLSLLQTLYA